ncbi:hypothetical protein ABPG75_007204 [Micractinium tetrahymenae]
MPCKHLRAAGGGGGGASKKAKGEGSSSEAPPQAYYLVKRCIDKLTVQDLEAAPNKTVAVDDIRNHLAKKILQTMQAGDEVLLYLCDNSKTKAKVPGCPGVFATCSVAKAAYPSPRDEEGKGWPAVDLKLEEAFEGAARPEFQLPLLLCCARLAVLKMAAADLKLEEAFEEPILLKALKAHADKELEGWSLFSNNMLSVHWVPAGMFNCILDEL